MDKPKDKKPSYLNFDKESYPWKKDIDYRLHPEKYRVGKGEQGVLICEPYKSEILPFWKFKTPDIATKSAAQISKLFKAYLKKKDFVGADMARKFLQMGFTRSRRYANYKSGKKYDKDKDYQLIARGPEDPIKAESAKIFYTAWQQAEANEVYKQLKIDWKKSLG